MPLCPACAQKLQNLITCKDKYTLLFCPQCSFITSSPLPTSEELEKFYQGFLFNVPREEQNENAGTTASIMEDVKKIVEDIKFQGTSGGKLLDCGGGNGRYAYAFSQRGFKVTMMDLDEKVCEYVKAQYPGAFKVICGNLIENLKQKYDVIFCNQLIEHFPNPHLFLQSLKLKLTKKGILIITTPNQATTEFYFRPKWFLSYIYMTTGFKLYHLSKAIYTFLRTPWLCCNPPRHLHTFNPKNINLFSQKNGFIAANIFTEYSIFQHYSPKKYTDFRMHKAGDVPKIILNIFAQGGIRLFKSMDQKNTWGSNLVVYAKAAV